VDVGAYVQAFNLAVASGEWASLRRFFTDRAVLEFVGPPIGPFAGWQAIAAAYGEMPPADGIEVVDVRVAASGETVVRFRGLSSDTGGTMILSEIDERIARMVISLSDAA
jgi:steroid Delta-isomerase